MEINIFTIACYILVILIFIWRIRSGYKKGLTAELNNMFSIIIAIAAGFVIKNGVEAYLDGRIGTLLSKIAVLGLIFVIQRIINFILKTIKIFAKLPIIRGLDKILGIAAGLLEAIAIVMFLVYAVKDML